MELSNEIVLRPRFDEPLPVEKESLFESFKAEKTSQKRFIVSLVDTHIFIKIPKKDQNFWTPQLHLEIKTDFEGKDKIHGFFGPNPTVWTMFMFLHFVLITSFLGILAWGYSLYSLKQGIIVPIGVGVFLVLMWLALYIGGRIGKKQGKREMQLLYGFYKEVMAKARI
ncbi:GTP-binding protein [Haloflavibacter putidus]|uniref:GTP-binding protein n=1 Tax=Haloflavibacter putidus TaxID=2576776 RepID=A0A507ZR55_9FLAO|nr:GTP-binding protein [Haloflavibacter putidus]TQD40080.1 GTP-binding protein [Haloflavibacter putidus]